MTGEVSILGHVMPVGGVLAKIEAAREAGVEKVLIPAENWQEVFAETREPEVIPVRRIEEVVALARAQ
jgi:Lon-like ATP-dependent protease